MKEPSDMQRMWARGISLLGAGVRSLKTDGVAETARITLRWIKYRPVSPSRWMKNPLYTAEELRAQTAHVFDRNVTFSVITPLYNTPEVFLREMVDSVRAQTYGNWELCLADGSDADHAYVQEICRDYARHDDRIHYKRLEENLGIAGNTNACIDLATGDYIALLDHDDLLHPAALFNMMEAISNEGADFAYTDEATFHSPSLSDISFIHFKPDFAPDNLLANNYICHFTAFKRSLFDACGPFRPGYDGAQDHELMLRLTRRAERIVHIPKVLYYWRAHPQSTAASVDNKPTASISGIKAVSDFLKASGVEASVTCAKDAQTIYRVAYALPTPSPKVSIVIPNRDHVEGLRACIESIRDKTTYDNYEIVIAENNSAELETFLYYEQLVTDSPDVMVVEWDGAFNWAAINNYAIQEVATGEYLLLLNNDTEVITPGWIEEMLMFAQRSDAGAVGAMLYYPDDTIQHAGVVLGLDGVAGNAFAHIKRGSMGYAGRLCYAQNYSAVTGACMLMRRDAYDRVGGIDESFPLYYSDVDLCLRLREAGYLVIWTPYAELYHYEGKSRGAPKTPKEKARREGESLRFKQRWKGLLDKGDPYYNPNLSLKHPWFSPKNKKHENEQSHLQ